MYVNLVYQLKSLVYDIKRLCAQVFHYSDFYLIYYAYLKSGQTYV
jgi:hypothetical protein